MRINGTKLGLSHDLIAGLSLDSQAVDILQPVVAEMYGRTRTTAHLPIAKRKDFAALWELDLKSGRRRIDVPRIDSRQVVAGVLAIVGTMSDRLSDYVLDIHDNDPAVVAQLHHFGTSEEAILSGAIRIMNHPRLLSRDVPASL